jgi:hypothetical protein
VDRFIELGILPTPSKDYNVKWADLFSISEKARVEIGKSRSSSIREYTSNPTAEAIIPPTVFMMKCLGFTTDEVELVNKIRDDEMEEEVKLMAKVKEQLDPPPPVQSGGGDRSKTERGEKKSKPTRGQGGDPKRRIRKAV